MNIIKAAALARALAIAGLDGNDTPTGMVEMAADMLHVAAGFESNPFAMPDMRSEYPTDPLGLAVVAAATASSSFKTGVAPQVAEFNTGKRNKCGVERLVVEAFGHSARSRSHRALIVTEDTSAVVNAAFSEAEQIAPVAPDGGGRGHERAFLVCAPRDLERIWSHTFSYIGIACDVSPAQHDFIANRLRATVASPFGIRRKAPWRLVLSTLSHPDPCGDVAFAVLKHFRNGVFPSADEAIMRLLGEMLTRVLGVPPCHWAQRVYYAAIVMAAILGANQ